MGLRFQHPAPIEVGEQGSIGWREEDNIKAQAIQAALAPPPPAPVAAVAAVAADGSAPKTFTMEEVANHNTEESVWFVHEGKVSWLMPMRLGHTVRTCNNNLPVNPSIPHSFEHLVNHTRLPSQSHPCPPSLVQVYDGTPFLEEHPGGAESILIVGGMDATEDFNAIHSSKAKAMLKDYYLGELVASKAPEPAAVEVSLGGRAGLAGYDVWHDDSRFAGTSCVLDS